MRRRKKRVRGGIAIRFALPPRKKGTSLDLLSGAGGPARVYRSTLGLLKYGLAGRAIITIAIATPASNDKNSILLTHLRVPTLRSIFLTARYLRSIVLWLIEPHLQTDCAFRAATRASVGEVVEERCGKPIRGRFDSPWIDVFPCVVCDASLLTGSRTKERRTPGSGTRTPFPAIR